MRLIDIFEERTAMGDNQADSGRVRRKTGIGWSRIDHVAIAIVYDGRGEPNSDMTFSAPTFIFLLKFLPCLSESSDGLDALTVPSALTPEAISDAD